MQPTHFLNGKLVKEEDLKVSVRDLGFSRGFAVFDFFITYPPQKPFMMNRHIDRIFNSASLINLNIPWTKEQVGKWVVETLNANNDGKEKAIRIIFSGGISDTVLPNPDNTTIVIQIDDRPYLPEELYETGVDVMTHNHTRYIPEAKTNNYIEAAKFTPAAKKSGAIELLYYNDESVLEFATSNVFAVIGGKLLTPKSNILPGVTRDVLLEILKLDIPVEERDFTIEELKSADEVFLSSSNKEVLPVTRIDGVDVGDGTVGKITKEAMLQFKNFTESWTDKIGD